MDLKELLDFIKKNKELLDELRKSTSDIISDAKALVIENNKKRAAAFVAALNDRTKVEGGEERLRGLNVAILELERELLETEDTARERVLNDQIADLLEMRAAVRVASGFNEIVVFTPTDKEEIAHLLQQAEEDIEARKDLKTAIDITVRLISLAAKIAGKASTFGIA